MATTIKLKNSVTTTNAPSSLVQGEVAINITDKKVWVGNAATTPIQLLGDGASANFGALSCTTLSVSGVATFSAGTVSAPAITTTGDTNTGIYFPAADTIAFTEGGVESMRINSSGNVGIGTSSPSYRLHTVSSAAVVARLGSSGGSGAFVNFIDSGASPTDAPSVGAIGNNLVFMGDGSSLERMRIDSSGNVGIGTSSPASFGALCTRRGISVANVTGSVSASFSDGANDTLYVSQDSALSRLTFSTLAFNTGTTERMRIASNGQVCINATSAVVDSNSKFVVSNKVTSGVAAEFSNNVSGTACVLINNEGSATSTLINWYAANAFRSSVTWNGTNIIYGTPSDQRLKENIVDSSSALPLINDIKIRSFDWKENGNHIDFGVIAQELESVMPEAVLKGKDNEDGSIKESWSVDTSTLVPALIKAIQEQQAMIEELRAEVALLKSK
jgi:hypothetical protein